MALSPLRVPALLPLACTGVLWGCASQGAPPEDPFCSQPLHYCFTFTSPEVPPGEEWQGYEAVPLQNAEVLGVVEVEIAQEGIPSHHFIVGRWLEEGNEPPYPGIFPLESLEGLLIVANMTTLLGSVFRYVSFQTGEYVGIPITTSTWVILNGHYINTGTRAARGITKVRLRTRPARALPFLAVAKLPGTTEIFVPPGSVSTATSIYEPVTDQAVLLMTSHMHRHGIKFEVFHVSPTGETLVYENTEWDHPELKIFSGPPNPDPLVLRQGRDFLRFRCTYKNDDLDRPLSYGPSANTDEMCIMPIYVIAEPDRLFEELGGKDLEGISWKVVPYE